MKNYFISNYLLFTLYYKIVLKLFIDLLYYKYLLSLYYVFFFFILFLNISWLFCMCLYYKLRFTFNVLILRFMYKNRLNISDFNQYYISNTLLLSKLAKITNIPRNVDQCNILL